MNKKILVALVGALVATSAEAQFSPWLQPEGELDVGFSYTHQSFDSFWVKNEKVDAPFGTIKQDTYTIPWEYGLSDKVAIGGTVGLTGTKPDADDLSDEDGLDDTYLGVRYNLFTPEEGSNLPILSAKLDAIIAGNYDTGTPAGPGDGGSGAQLVFGAGKDLTESFGVYGNVGYRARNNNVPADMLYYASAYYNFMENFTFTAGFRLQQGLSGIDLSDPDFNPTRFPELKERAGVMEFTLGYTLEEGHYIGVFYADTVEGRNTGETQYFGVSLNYSM